MKLLEWAVLNINSWLCNSVLVETGHGPDFCHHERIAPNVEYVTRQQWEHAKKQSSKQWNGEGLPPVGTVCEWLASGDHDWVKVTVLGHNGDDTWLKPDDGTQSFVVSCAENFRPVQNEREKAIDEILQIIDHNGVDPLNSAKQIYDAGYRKHDAVSGFEWRYVCQCCGTAVKPGEETPHGC